MVNFRVMHQLTTHVPIPNICNCRMADAWEMDGDNDGFEGDCLETAAGKEYYTFVVHYPGLHPKHFIPNHPVYDKKGKAMQSQYGNNQLKTECGTPDTVKHKKVVKWTTKADVLSAMQKPHASICNSLKAWFNKSGVAVFFHNALTDKCSQFRGPHIHVISRSEETTTGRFRKLWDVSLIKTLKKKLAENGGYFRCEAVKRMSGLMKYLVQPPRVYMGTNAKVLYEAYKDAICPPGPNDAPEDDDYLDAEDADVLTDEEPDLDFTGFEDDGPSTSKRAAEDGWEVEFSIQPPKKPATQVNYTSTDAMLGLIRRLMLYFGVYSMADFWKVVNKPGKHDEYHARMKSLWFRLSCKPRVKQWVENVKSSLESETIHKPFAELIDGYCKTRPDDDEYYESPESSYEIFCEWCTDQSINVIDFVKTTFDVMDRVSSKFNTMCFIGEPNSGKTMMIQSPLKAVCMFVGQMGNRAANGTFMFSDLPNKRLLCFDECVFAREQMEDMKLLWGGEEIKVDVKYNGLTPVQRTPCILTGNRDPWTLSYAAKEPLSTRMHYYPMKQIPELVNVKKQMSPKMWWFLMQLKNLSIHDAIPNITDLVSLDPYVVAEDITLN